MLGLVHAVELVFDAAETRPTASEAPARWVFGAWRDGDLKPVRPVGNGVQLQACTHLDEAIRSARDHGGAIADLADTLDSVAPQLNWVRRRGPERQTTEFAHGHANAVLIRSDDSESDVVVGISLLAPHVRYPDHHHPPEEVYIVLSPGEWRQGHETWHEPGVGNIVHNPPGVVHAMRSSDAPLLALWLQFDKRSTRERSNR